MRPALLSLLGLALLSSCGPEASHDLKVVQGDAPALSEEQIHIGNALSESTVLIVKRQGTRWRQWCGGVLIGKDAVLTAAHCLVDNPSPENLRIVFERRYHFAVFDQLRSLPVRSQASHPEFDPALMGGFFAHKPVHDIAVIRFDGDIPAPYHPIALVPEDMPIANACPLVISGFGRTRPAPAPLAESQGTLNFGFTEIGAFLPWQQEFRNANKTPTFCNGDSGSPAFVKQGDRWLVSGIVSRGDARCAGQGLFTDVRGQLPWIHSQL